MGDLKTLDVFLQDFPSFFLSLSENHKRKRDGAECICIRFHLFF